MKRVRDTAGTQADLNMREAQAVNAAADEDEAVQPEPEDDLAEALRLAERIEAGELISDKSMSDGEFLAPLLEEDDPEPPAPVSASPARIPESAPVASNVDFLEAVRKANALYTRRQKAVDEAMAALQEAAKTARIEGKLSLRKVAAAAGVSYDTVDRWSK